MSAGISSVAGSLATKIQVFFSGIPEYARAGYGLALPKLMELVAKTRALWIQMLPYVKASIIFCLSPIGISIAIIGLATIPLRISRSCSSTMARISWLALGIITAGVGAYMLSTTGVIPAFTAIV